VALVAPGQPDASELIRRITTDDESERMPPPDSQRKLTPAQIDRLKRWVAEGATWEGHWSFQPIVQPPVPDSAASFPDYAARNPIDSFVLQRLAREGLSPAPPASKERLLRRVTLDLTGLPPTLEDVDAFLADQSPAAYERVVDRLLQSPHYGERMAWEWLDAARYADSNGFQGDSERTMWPWRDWVAQAYNDNLPYDQFTIWQLAGDLLPDASHEQKLATGFCRNHMINGEGGRIPEENRIEYIFDQLETVGTIWMGLTWQCSRCHDHKFDPLTRREYYQLFAFFNRTPVTGGGGNPQTPPVLETPTSEQQARLKELEQEVELQAAEVSRAEKTSFARPDGKAAAESAQARQLPESIQKALSKPPRERNVQQLSEIEKHFADSDADYAGRVRTLRERVGERDGLRAAIPRVMVMQDTEPTRQTFMLTKGLYNQPGEEVTAGVPAIFTPLASDVAPDRLALARWLMSPNHPLAARVTVNRQWQMFFGTGFIKTAEDFGEQGERPSHPELLDWLAGELLRSGWDMKHLHRLIVRSATYRQSACASATAFAADPENRLLARGPRFRLSSWMMRDQALAASGLLVPRIGGPPVKPYQPPGVWDEATFGNKKYEQDHGDDLYRRSLYTFWRRIIGPTLFFDTASRQTCSVRVARTNTPLHALTTLNDVTYIEAARVMAQRVLADDHQDQPEAALDEARVQVAFRLAASRPATAEELAVLLRRLQALKQQYTAAPDEARQLLAVGESARHKQLDVVDHAAWTGLCSLILNLDEVLTK